MEDPSLTEATDGRSQARSTTGTRRSALTFVRRLVAPIVVGLAGLSIWESGLIHWLLQVETYTLAYPTDIVEAVIADLSTLWGSTWVTLQEAAVGYAVGSSIGFVLAVVLSEVPTLRRALLPVISGFTAMPVIALAPLMVLYFGFGLLSKIAVVVIMTLPPMTVTTFKGLTSADAELGSVLRSCAAGRFDVLTKLRLPWSLPFVFTGLKLNVVLSLIGALIAEFFSSREGLGYRMSYALDTFDMPIAWATMLIAALVGVIWYQIIVGAERLVIPWHASIRKQSA